VPIAPGPTRHDDQWAVARNGWRGMSFEEWGDLSVGIASPVKNKIGLGRHDRAAFNLCHLRAGARFPEAPCTGCGKWTCANAQKQSLEFMRKS
jgi:hypothetical protein